MSVVTFLFEGKELQTLGLGDTRELKGINTGKGRAKC
jgi:hypothetical protein